MTPIVVSLAPQWARHGPDVARAAGMVAAQVGCSADRALWLLQERARAGDRTLDAVAVAVIDRVIRFRPSGSSA